MIKVIFKKTLLKPDIYQGIDENAPNYHVISFGNCYLDSYSTQGSVGQFAKASVSYTAYNVNFNSSGSGFLDSEYRNQERQTISPAKDVVILGFLAEEGYAA